MKPPRAMGNAKTNPSASEQQSHFTLCQVRLWYQVTDPVEACRSLLVRRVVRTSVVRPTDGVSGQPKPWPRHPQCRGVRRPVSTAEGVMLVCFADNRFRSFESLSHLDGRHRHTRRQEDFPPACDLVTQRRIERLGCD
jgi:hypothetical protein